MENKESKIPKWYWAMTFFFLFWNLMGVVSFCMQLFVSEEALQAMPEAEQELYGSYPMWTKVAFAVAVAGGILGCVGLLLAKKWAKSAFVISLLAIIPQMAQNLFFSKAREVYGPGTKIMPILIIVTGIFLVWFSTYAIRNNWIT